MPILICATTKTRRSCRPINGWAWTRSKQHFTIRFKPMPQNNQAAALNTRYRHHGAHDVLTYALSTPALGRLALVSSFGAESVVLLHMMSVIAPRTPVLFVDTQMLFAQTLDYQHELSTRLGLRDL